jgi:hypothetical protein
LLPLFLAAGWLATHKQAVPGKMWRVFLTDIAVLASMPALFILGQYLTRFLNEQMVSFVSYSAFALYLFHRIIFLAFPSLPTLPAFQFLYTMGVLLPVSIVICYFIQLAFDKLLGRSHVKLKTTTAIESAT